MRGATVAHEQGASAAGDAPVDNGVLSTNQLLERVYGELRALAAYHLSKSGGERTMPPTAVVHEAYLRLAEQERQHWSGRAEFLAVASIMIRRILVDQARRRGNGQRCRQEVSSNADPGPNCQPGDLLSLDEALTALAQLSERQARVVELRYFGGLTVLETAQAMDISEGTVKSDWRLARAWLCSQFGS
jgi:RNA polymerase sigma-70 factor, ECF subfamily